MARARSTADRLVTSSTPNVPNAVKLVRMTSGADRMDVIGVLAGLAWLTVLAGLSWATAGTSQPPDGWDVLDAVGAGVGLGAADGDFEGGARVGDGLGAADVVLPAGCVPEVPALGVADP
jgi:hypothetical protein